MKKDMICLSVLIVSVIILLFTIHYRTKLYYKRHYANHYEKAYNTYYDAYYQSYYAVNCESEKKEVLKKYGIEFIEKLKEEIDERIINNLIYERLKEIENRVYENYGIPNPFTSIIKYSDEESNI